MSYTLRPFCCNPNHDCSYCLAEGCPDRKSDFVETIATTQESLGFPNYGRFKSAPIDFPKTPTIVSLQEESLAIHYVRLAAEALTKVDVDAMGHRGSTHFICNDLKLPKRLSHEKQTFLMLELISREPRPFVEYLETQRLRKAEVVGDGTKKSPYKAQWREDYYID